MTWKSKTAGRCWSWNISRGYLSIDRIETPGKLRLELQKFGVSPEGKAFVRQLSSVIVDTASLRQVVFELRYGLLSLRCGPETLYAFDKRAKADIEAIEFRTAGMTASWAAPGRSSRRSGKSKTGRLSC